MLYSHLLRKIFLVHLKVLTFFSKVIFHCPGLCLGKRSGRTLIGFNFTLKCLSTTLKVHVEGVFPFASSFSRVALK